MSRSKVMRTRPELIPHSLSFHTTPTGRLSVPIDLTCISPSERRVFSDIRTRTRDLSTLATSSRLRPLDYHGQTSQER
ncbi:hypothetical protein TNCV_1099571 [Trichonephila clavipes]|nr:hypothetical protein TNCV_1099571 [Trichonephila clavipes]